MITQNKYNNTRTSTKKTPSSSFYKLPIFVIFSIFLILIIPISLSIITAQNLESTTSDFNVCCEKTKSGAWCQNTREENCNPSFRKTPTSCDATSFCKLGICVDSEEGICDKNTPQKVCQITTGSWIDDDETSIPQCTLGCCLLGDQASFVTLTRCKRISNIYGLQTNFKNDVTDEVECILLAHAQDEGACVFESNGERNCEFTTRLECSGNSNNLDSNLTGNTEFFKDYLCSADELATSCGPTRETTCIEGRDEIYFKDSCGNRANIYDSNKVYSKSPSYWQKVVNKPSSCNSNSPNINSKSCGNCNYLGGSICGKGNPTFGDFICKDLNCKKVENGNDYRNGESWCEYMGDVGNGQDTVGSRQFRHICIQGEEIIEPCADFRNEVCIQQSMGPQFGDFSEAACRVNRWTDCLNQFTEDDCLNSDKRDCFWASGLHYDGSGSDAKTKSLADSGLNPNQESPGFFDNIFGNNDDEIVRGTGIVEGGSICLPNTPVGLKFWEDSNAKSICNLGNSRQIVEFTSNILGDKKCEENCEVLETKWVDTLNNVCTSLGDCGAYINFNNKYTDNGIVWRQDGKRKSIQTGLFENFRESSSSTSSNSNTNTNTNSDTSNTNSETTQDQNFDADTNTENEQVFNQ